MRLAPFALLIAAATAAAQDTAADIMTKMTANVEKAADARRLYVYEQKVRSSMVRSGGQVSRWEKRTYTALPGPEHTEKKLTSFEGQYLKGKQMLPYDKPGFTYKGVDLDGGILSDLTNDLVDDHKSRDGIPHGLFPLRSSDLRYYRFTSKPDATVKGRRTHVIDFEPLPAKNKCLNMDGDDQRGNDDPPCNGRVWKGTAWIDAEELQPARIQTSLNLKIPAGVRIFLGTNLSQTGFSVAYERVAENVWFPATYGTEFRFNVLWGYKRTVTLSLESSGFRKTDVNSAIHYDADSADAQRNLTSNSKNP